MPTLETFRKNDNYLVCVDSDGCVMDAQTIKHTQAFGPCLIHEWRLAQWSYDVQNKWNEINLYSETRGINRFEALAVALRYINDTFKPVSGIQALESWVEMADELSNDSIREMTKRDWIFVKALEWSLASNNAIGALPDGAIHPFNGVYHALSLAHEYADIAVVTSAGRDAIAMEWTRYGILPLADVLCSQENGSEETILMQLRQKGYRPQNMIMCGDSIADERAAARCGIRFFPILVGDEEDSWLRFEAEGFPRLMEGSYTDEYQEMQCRHFYENFRGSHD